MACVGQGPAPNSLRKLVREDPTNPVCPFYKPLGNSALRDNPLAFGGELGPIPPASEGTLTGRAPPSPGAAFPRQRESLSSTWQANARVLSLPSPRRHRRQYRVTNSIEDIEGAHPRKLLQFDPARPARALGQNDTDDRISILPGFSKPRVARSSHPPRLSADCVQMHIGPGMRTVTNIARAPAPDEEARPTGSLQQPAMDRSAALADLMASQPHPLFDKAPAPASVTKEPLTPLPRDKGQLVRDRALVTGDIEGATAHPSHALPSVVCSRRVRRGRRNPMLVMD